MTTDKGKVETHDMSNLMETKPYGNIGPDRTQEETKVVEKIKKKKKVEVAEGSSEESGTTANVGEVSKAIGRGGHNIKLAGQLTGYELDVIREGTVAADDDVELTEFSDEIEDWVIEEFAKIGLDTAKSILSQDVNDLVRRTDLEEETILEVVRILKEEFEE